MQQQQQTFTPLSNHIEFLFSETYKPQEFNYYAGFFMADGDFMVNFKINSSNPNKIHIEFMIRFSQSLNPNLIQHAEWLKNQLKNNQSLTQLKTKKNTWISDDNRIFQNKIRKTPNVINFISQHYKERALNKRLFTHKNFTFVKNTPWGRLGATNFENISLECNLGNFVYLNEEEKKTLTQYKTLYADRRLFAWLAIKQNEFIKKNENYKPEFDTQNLGRAERVTINNLTEVKLLITAFETCNDSFQSSININQNPFIGSKALSFLFFKRLLQLNDDLLNKKIFWSQESTKNLFVAFKVHLNQGSINNIFDMSTSTRGLEYWMEKLNLKTVYLI
jgi:hypothetical protein